MTLHADRLGDLVVSARSKNAGPFCLTIDLFFGDQVDFDRVADSGAMTPERISGLFGLPPEEVRVFEFKPALALKITIPRPVASGSPGDRDIFGGQQFPPILEVMIPRSTG